MTWFFADIFGLFLELLFDGVGCEYDGFFKS